jgi:hypothetical protein
VGTVTIAAEFDSGPLAGILRAEQALEVSR